MTEPMLSKYLSVKKFTKSETASRYGISNDIAPEHMANARRTAAAYDLICEALGRHLGLDGPVILDGNSFYRAKAVNDAVNKAAGRAPGLPSYHMEALAMDLDDDAADARPRRRMTDMELAKFIAALADLPYDKVILEYGWVHVQMARDGAKPRRTTWTIKSANSPALPGFVA